MNELALFAGAGGGILGGKLLGWRTVCAVECNAYAASVLCARQNDGLLPPFPVWDDVCTFDGRSWRGIVDVVSGGFPCQDISAAGKGAGIDGEKSGLWGEMARIIGEVRPGKVFVENSPMLTLRGLSRVLGDLAALGYDAEWGVLGAQDVGAPHQRERIWIVAHSAEYDCNARRAEPARQQRPARIADGRHDVAYPECSERRPECGARYGLAGKIRLPQREESTSGAGKCCKDVGHADSLNGGAGTGWHDGEKIGDAGWWAVEPDVGRVVNGLAARVDRLTTIGNGQVPACAAEAFRRLTEYR